MSKPLQTRFQPELIAESAYVAANATLRGEVYIGEEACILFGAVLRGDCEPIRVGNQSNIQDLCCLHSDPGIPCTVGNRVTVGHGAFVHGATVEDECLIGIKAVLLNGCVIGTGSVVAAGSLVTEGKIIPPHSVVMGVPAKVVRETTDRDKEMIVRGWQHYVQTAKDFREADLAASESKHP
jgi:carbonic anhydrase/acetyltransferase-like protein (isoleucine patch superfamily)